MTIKFQAVIRECANTKNAEIDNMFLKMEK